LKHVDVHKSMIQRRREREGIVVMDESSIEVGEFRPWWKGFQFRGKSCTGRFGAFIIGN
jgi:hypothetical protein